MAKRKFNEKLIHISKINEELRPLPNSNVDYITPTGKVYCDYGNDMYYPKANSLNKHNGYLYTSIKCSDGKQRGCRTHRLVAQAYLPNPNNYPVVMHLDNNKANPNLENLKWATVSENTKAAFDDGLAYNKSGEEDEQSIPVMVFNENMLFLDICDTIRMASKKYNVSMSTVTRHCRHEIPGKSRCGYRFRYLSEYMQYGFVL